MAIEKMSSLSSLFPQINRIDSGSKEISGTSSAGGATASQKFGNIISDSVQQINQAVNGFEEISKKFANGEQVNVHEMMLKGEQADMGLRLMLSLRNKVVEAYQDIMRLPV